MVRFTGDTLALSPPLIVEDLHLYQIFEIIRKAIRKVA